MRRILVLFCVLAGLWGGPLRAAQAVPPPTPQRWVTDGPGFLTPPVREALDLRLEAYQKGTGHQVLVWIGPTTSGDPLEDWTVRAFAAWKVGRKGLDDGLVIFIFSGDRKVRLEVGYGLEGQMPDAVASRIIQETILPRIKSGDADGAVTAGVERVLQVVGGDSAAAQAQDTSRPLGPVAWILIALLGLGFLALAITHPGLAIWLLLDLMSGGRRGGGGGGGGGWSGGGGSSGGGGASGSW